MIRVLVFLVIVALAVYAVVDISNSEDDDRRGLPMGVWLVLAVIVPVLGPVLWFSVSHAQRAARAGGGGAPRQPRPAGPAARGPRGPQRPVAPDDDPEFLWRLDQEQRRRDREQREGEGQGPE